MSQKWNLQDIRPANREKRAAVQTNPLRRQQDIGVRTPEPRTQAPFDEDLGTIDIIDGKSTKRKRVFVSVLVSLCIIGAAFFTNVMLGGAEIVVYPKFKDASVQATFSAHKTPRAGELSFELLSLDATGERQVKAAGQELVSERAIGSILIYNTKLTTTQRLIKNTRFESPEGLIFRIKESAEVPAATTDAKGNLVSGVTTVEVFADGTGEQYNITPARFTIPGLKGSDQYDAMYGESTVAFTGGFEGNKYVIDDAELQKAKQELHLELRNTLLEQLKSSRPSGFVVYDNAVTFIFESLPSTAYGDSLATIKEKAILSVPLLKENEFAEYLARNTVDGYEEASVALTNPLTLSFSYEEATTTTSDIRTLDELSFILKGTTQIVWQFDEEKLKSDLQKLPKTALPTVLSGYPSIDRANATIRPFWTQKFPENPDDIEVKKIIGTERAE